MTVGSQPDCCVGYLILLKKDGCVGSDLGVACYSTLLDSSFSGHQETAPVGIQCSFSKLCSHVADNAGSRLIAPSESTLTATTLSAGSSLPPDSYARSGTIHSSNVKKENNKYDESIKLN